MSDSVLTAAAVGAAIAGFLILLGITEIGMRQQPKPPAIFRTLELGVSVFIGAAIVLAAYWGTLHKPYVPTGVNQICLVVAAVLVLWDLAIFICASSIKITRKPPSQ